jgi:hypothetical protein
LSPCSLQMYRHIRVIFGAVLPCTVMCAVSICNWHFLTFISSCNSLSVTAPWSVLGPSGLLSDKRRRFFPFTVKWSRCQYVLTLILNYCSQKHFFFLWRCNRRRAMTSSFLRFLDHTQRRITVSRTSMDERSARRRDLYLTTHNTQHRQTSMPRWDSNPQSQQANGRRPTP